MTVFKGWEASVRNGDDMYLFAFLLNPFATLVADEQVDNLSMFALLSLLNIIIAGVLFWTIFFFGGLPWLVALWVALLYSVLWFFGQAAVVNSSILFAVITLLAGTDALELIESIGNFTWTGMQGWLETTSFAQMALAYLALMYLVSFPIGLVRRAVVGK